MGFLSILVLIPFLNAFGADAPDCGRLRNIADELEKKIQSTHLGDATKSCEQLTPKDLELPEGALGLSGDWDYRCKNLSAIDLQLKSIENEIALLNGMIGLREDIKKGIGTLQKFTNPDLAKDATGRFLKNLEVAQTLELFLATNNSKGENILSELVKGDDKNWSSLSAFAKHVEAYCKDHVFEGASVCANNFRLSEEVFKEINGLVRVGKHTERKFNKRHIEELSEALTIKAKDKKFSYTDLASTISKPGSNGILSKEDLQKLKELPPLSNSNKYDFLKQMKASLKDLKDSEELSGAQEIPNRFQALLNDLKARQQWEMKSKLSLVLHDYEEKMPEDAAQKCNEARELQVKVEDCLKPLKEIPGITNLEKTILDDYITEFKYGEDHLSKLDELLKECVPTEKLEYPASKCEGMITKNMDDLVVKAQTLQTLKAKLLQKNPELVTMRNFALEQLESEQCMNVQESNIVECSVPLGSISSEAIVLTADAKDILHVFTLPEEDTDISQICAEGKEEIYGKKDLCILMEESVKQSSQKNPAPEKPMLDPHQRNKSKEHLADFIGALSKTIGNYFSPQNKPGPQNPFPYVPMYSGRPMDISQKIMTPYMASGYGNYMPTPGLRPYSSVNSNVATYAGYTFGTSARFNSPVGW